jgi:hypothetical protein
VRLELSDQALMVVMNALGNHPYREAAPVVVEIQRQYNQQRMNGSMSQQTESEQPHPE